VASGWGRFPSRRRPGLTSRLGYLCHGIELVSHAGPTRPFTSTGARLGLRAQVGADGTATASTTGNRSNRCSCARCLSLAWTGISSVHPARSCGGDPTRTPRQCTLSLLGDAAAGVRAESSAPVENECGAPADKPLPWRSHAATRSALSPEVSSTARACAPFYVGRL
jgi:hypothetical protein